MKTVIRPETEMKDSGIECIESIPKGWITERIKNLFSERNEKVDDAEPNELLSVSEYYGVAPRSEKINSDTVLVRAESLQGYKRCEKNDLVSNIMLAWKGAMGISQYRGVVSPSYCVYTPKKGICSQYYHYLFRTDAYKGLFKKYSTGIIESRLRLYTEQFFERRAIVPPLSEQQSIADYLDKTCSKIDEIIAEAKASINEYKELRNSIITNKVSNGVRYCKNRKDTDNLLLGKIPSHWKVCKVKNIASYVSDGAHVSPETDNGVYDFISTVNLQEGKIQFDNCLKTSIGSYEQLVKNGCKPQLYDVLISKDGTVGKTTVIDYERDFVVASSLVIIRPRLNMINPYYLEYNLQSYFAQETLQMLLSGAGLKRVSVGKNATLPVVLPPLEEQQEIVNWLDEHLPKYDSLIAEKESLIADLEAYKKSLIYEVVTGKRRVV